MTHLTFQLSTPLFLFPLILLSFSFPSLPLLLTPQWICLSTMATVYFAVQQTIFQEVDSVFPVMDNALHVRGAFWNVVP